MLKTKKINNVEIQPVLKKKAKNKSTIKGYDFYPEPYSNIALLARKGSGKTVTIYRALEECVDKGTTIWIFCSSINTDATYDKMCKMLKKKKCVVHKFEHFINDQGINELDIIIKMLSQKEEDNEMAEMAGIEKPPPLLYFGGSDFKSVSRPDGETILVEKPKQPAKIKKEKKEKAKKKIAQEHVFIFDDLSSDMKHKSISKLLCKNRHIKSKVFCAIHHVNNLDPTGLRMIDAFHIFPNISEEKILETAEKIGLTFKGDTKKQSRLNDLYHHATQEPHNFLYIDRANNEFRKNFNEKYEGIDD